MAARIRLRRVGTTKKPAYRVVVADGRWREGMKKLEKQSKRDLMRAEGLDKRRRR